MKSMKALLLTALIAIIPAQAFAIGIADGRMRRYTTRAECVAAAASMPPGTFCYANDSKTWYVSRGSVAQPPGQSGFPEYKITCDEGAFKGMATLGLAGAAASTTTGATNMLYLSTGATDVGGARLLYSNLGSAGSSGTAPAMVATGLDITGDQHDNDGFEFVGGTVGATGRPMVPGTDPAFQLCVTITVTDVSDTDRLVIGWRSIETVNATDAEAYETYAAIGIVASAATAKIQLTTEDDDAGTTTTDTTNTWADTATKALCVLVGTTGAVTYTINGTAPTATAAFSFDDGEPLEPFLYFLHAGAADCVPIVSSWEVAYTSP